MDGGSLTPNPPLGNGSWQPLPVQTLGSRSIGSLRWCCCFCRSLILSLPGHPNLGHVSTLRLLPSLSFPHGYEVQALCLTVQISKKSQGRSFLGSMNNSDQPGAVWPQENHVTFLSLICKSGIIPSLQGFICVEGVSQPGTEWVLSKGFLSPPSAR